MSGSTMTVTAPAVDPIQSHSHTASHFHRSHSTSDLDQLSGVPRRLPLSSASPTSSSHTQGVRGLSDFDVALNFDFEPNLSSKLSLSADDLRLGLGTNEASTTERSEEILSASDTSPEKMGKGKSTLSKPQIRTPTSESVPSDKGREDGGEKTTAKGTGNGQESGGSKFLEPPSPRGMSKSVTDSLTSLARRSWMATTRSPSPNGTKETSKETPDEASRPEPPSRGRSGSLSATLSRKMSRRRPAPVTVEEGRAADSRGKLGSYLTKIKQRPQVTLAKGRPSNDCASTTSSTSSLAPASIRTRRSHTSEVSSNTAPDDASAVPRVPRARDPLWSVFKNLESEYGKFQSKSAPARMNQVRSILLPFLRTYATHTSNKRLASEDLERRAVILDRWWGGLLEMLEGKAEISVAGMDRPTLIEVVTLIMMRPEWRQGIAGYKPLSDRGPGARPTTRQRGDTNTSSRDSVDSTDSEYFAESAEHNVKTMFVANLVSQMAIVVDKLSLRHAPLALVNFAGKTCAYAFFFAPGIADILVRLWALKPETIRRVADELGLPRRSAPEDIDTTTMFPPNLAPLCWSSTKTILTTLRQAPTLPLTASKIAWHGPWVSRWRGRETDLFFIFCKYYYILTEEFMPFELTLAEKARAPGFVLVNAHILSVLDSTVHRQATAEASLGPPLGDASPGHDAIAMPLPVSANALKGMTDNRLVVLLKDILTGASVRLADARHTFAQSFMAVMKASAKRTSQYDHNACFVLCDFLEEALQAFDEFVDVRIPGLNYIDWAFWLDALRRITDSNHTMSEIRVLSLLFSLWDVIAGDQARKEQFCIDWLLTPETFNKFFTNWCPMIRAYYMRLLCWRICRDPGNANNADAKIFLLVSSRLRTTWAHYLWLKQDAENNDRLAPSTAPNYPAPGKRFMIIRTEATALQSGLVVGFDHFANSVPSPQAEVPSSDPANVFDTLDSPVFETKKKWGIFGRVLSLTGNNNSANDLESVRRVTAMSRGKPGTPPKSQASAVTPPDSDTDSMGSSPTYETLQYIFKFVLSWNALGTMTPPNRILTRPRLPSPAQSWVHSSRDAGGILPRPISPPAPTRAFSGSSHAGLINSARNADPADVSPHSPSFRISTTLDRTNSHESENAVDRTSLDESPDVKPTAPCQETITQPVQPTGIYAATAKYAGRALAEWGLVVGECNGFIDRRRDEGVPSLSEVEVPSLGVEGIKKMG